MSTTNLENNLNLINSKFVSLDKEETKKNTGILNEVIADILKGLKKNSLFSKLCTRAPFYGGSYYENLKVSKPNEYDIGILLDLPKLADPKLTPSMKAGHVNVKISFAEIDRQSYLAPFRDLRKIVDHENFLSVKKMNSWFEGLVQTVLNTMSFSHTVTMRKTGPAITLRVNVGWNSYFDVDLVPFFYFEKSFWPNGYKQYSSNDGFFIVPKLLPDGDARKWRATFQSQEKAIITDVGKIKPAMRLIKVLRDNEKWSMLKSYFIKSVFLWELTYGESENYANKTLSATFIKFMEKLIEAFRKEEIKYLWHDGYNLLENWNSSQCSNIAYRLENVLRKIKNDPNNVWQFYKSNEEGEDDEEEEEEDERNNAVQGVSNDLLLAGGIVAGLGALAIGGFSLYRALNNNRNE